MSIRVVVVDDQPLVRAGFRMILSVQADLEVAGEAAVGAQALRLVEQLHAAGTPADIVVMDIRMPVNGFLLKNVPPEELLGRGYGRSHRWLHLCRHAGDGSEAHPSGHRRQVDITVRPKW